jgi:hypothetical protein
MEDNQELENETETAESQEVESMLMRKRPSIFWMAATVLILVASLLELYTQLHSPIPTPASIENNMSVEQLVTLNTTAINASYNKALSNRGIYEIVAGLIGIVSVVMTVKNVYLKFRK